MAVKPENPLARQGQSILRTLSRLASPCLQGEGGPRERWKGLAGTEKIRCVKADRPLAARTAMECHSGALPHTPFCHCVALPSRGNERIRQGRNKPEGLSRHWRRIKWRRKAPYPASAAILYNYPVPAGTQPVREASAGPGQNPWHPGAPAPAVPSTLAPVRARQPSGIQPDMVMALTASGPLTPTGKRRRNMI